MTRSQRRRIFEAAEYVVTGFHILLFGIFVLPWLLWV